MRNTSRKVSRRGFIFPEAVAGLSLLMMLGVVLALALNRQASASRRSAALLQAHLEAQQALLAAEQSEPTTASTSDTVRVELRPRDASGVQWIFVTATRAGQTIQLVGPKLSGAMP